MPEMQYIEVKPHSQLHKMWDKAGVVWNNSGIDVFKASDVTNNTFGTEPHCLTHQPSRAPASTTECLLLGSQLWAYLKALSSITFCHERAEFGGM